MDHFLRTITCPAREGTGLKERVQCQICLGPNGSRHQHPGPGQRSSSAR